MKSEKSKIFQISLVVIICLGLCVSLVSAASKYYKYRWTNEVSAVSWHNEYVINDVIEIDDGYAAIGFDDDRYPIVRILDEDGLLINEVKHNLDYGFMPKRIFEIDGGYIVVGIERYTVVAFTIDEDYNIVSLEDYYTDYFDWCGEIYFEEDDKYIYLLSDCEDYSLVRISKDIDFIDFNEIEAADYTSKLKKMVYKYIDAWDYVGEESETDAYIEPVFVADYADGYIYGLNNFDDDIAIIIYIVDGEEVWRKNIENSFVRDGIQFGDNFIIGYLSYDEDESYLQMYDVEGNDLGKDSLLNYISEESDVFTPEHLIAVGKKGFALTGSKEKAIPASPVEIDGVGSKVDKPSKKPEKKDREEKIDKEPPADIEGITPKNENEHDVEGLVNSSSSSQILYFDGIYNITTKTDGNGIVESTKVQAGWGEEIQFTVTANEGYVLNEIKVTDANGDVVTFTENTFTMPNADVLIEATFSVKNPETYAFISIAVVIILGLSVFLTVKFKKKLRDYDGV